MLFCQVRRRHKHRRQPSCWRNPFLVFLLSFAALGSLRFRTRTRNAATALLRHNRNNSNQKHLTNSEPTHDNIPMHYNLAETGTTVSGHAFQRYQAVQSLADGTAGAPVTVQQWAQAMADTKSPAKQQQHALQITNILRDVHFAAFFFETKGVSAQTAASKSFEFVLVNAPHLKAFGRTANPAAFADHLSALNSAATAGTFPNAAGDAVLIAPTQLAQIDSLAYAHFANFCRLAPAHQVTAVWQQAAAALLDRLRNDSGDNAAPPVWFSTSGMGVAWLHFRLDNRPKYYSFPPFALET